MRYLMPILLFLAASLSIPPARGDWIEQSDRFAMQVLTARAALQPEYASNYGLQQFDGDVADLGPDISQRWRSLNRDLVQKLSASLSTERNARVRQDLEIMIDALRADIETEELEQKYLLPYYNLHELMFLSFRSLLDPRSEAMAR